MPIESCTLPNGGSGYRWGKSGKCFADRADAEKQVAACANGYTGDRLALDRASARSVDAAGHMRVLGSTVSLANVCEYAGHEAAGRMPGSCGRR